MTTYVRWWVEVDWSPWSEDWFWSYWHRLGASSHADPDREGWPLLCGRSVNTLNMTTTEVDVLPDNWVLPPGGKPTSRAAPLCRTCERVAR